MEFKNIFRHLHLVNKHRFYVFKNCAKAGIIWQGLTHDLSKYSPTEFFESVQYFDGEISPIDVCKREKGYSNAWLHHKGRNKHHYEYYVDNCDNGGVAIQMPFKDVVELICDYLGAGQAYMKKDFSYEAEYKWWQNKKSKPLLMHNQTKIFIEKCLFELKNNPNNDKNILNKRNLLEYYKWAETLDKTCQSSN